MLCCAPGARYEGQFDSDRKHGPGVMYAKVNALVTCIPLRAATQSLRCGVSSSLQSGAAFRERWVHGERVSSEPLPLPLASSQQPGAAAAAGPASVLAVDSAAGAKVAAAAGAKAPSPKR